MMARVALLAAAVSLGAQAIQLDDDSENPYRKHTTPEPPSLGEILAPVVKAQAALKALAAPFSGGAPPAAPAKAPAAAPASAAPKMYQKSAVKPAGGVLGGLGQQMKWDGLRGVVLFVGANKTGSSLMAAVLNAHPRILLPNEYNLLDHLDKKAETIYHEMHSLSVLQATLHKGYTLNGQWQGKVQDNQPYLIGDKKVVTTENELDELTAKISKLGAVTNLPVYLVHLTNPAQAALGGGAMKAQLYSKWIGDARKREMNNQIFLEMVQRNPEKLGKKVKLVNVDLQAFGRNPAAGTASLCGQLGVECSKEYVEAVTKLITETPPNQRFW